MEKLLQLIEFFNKDYRTTLHKTEKSIGDVFYLWILLKK